MFVIDEVIMLEIKIKIKNTEWTTGLEVLVPIEKNYAVYSGRQEFKPWK